MSFISNALSYVGMGGQDKPAARATSGLTATIKSVTPARSRNRNDYGQISTINISSYSQAREVSDAFRDGLNVIVEMGEATETDQAKMVNYMLGLKEGLYGKLQRVTRSVFLLSHEGSADGDDFDDAHASHDNLIIRP